MKRLMKAQLLAVRTVAYRWNLLRLYYWAETKLYDLRSVYIIPDIVYEGIFRVSMRLVAHRHFRRVADKAIHLIPYHIRFQLA